MSRRLTQQAIAEKFGISQQAVSYIRRREGYRDEDRRAERDACIRQARAAGETARVVAQRHGLSVRQVRRIWNGS